MKFIKNGITNIRYQQKLIFFFVITIITYIQSSRSIATFRLQLPESELEFKEECFLDLLLYTGSIWENDPELARRIVNLVAILREIDWENQEISYKPVHSNHIHRCYSKYCNQVSRALSTLFSDLALVPSELYVDFREKFFQVNSRQSFEKIKDFLLDYSKSKGLNTHQKILLSSCATKVLVKYGVFVNPAAAVFHISYYRSPLAVFDTHCRGFDNTSCIEYTTLALDLMKHLGVAGKRYGPTLNGIEFSAVFLISLNVQGFLTSVSEGSYLRAYKNLWLASFFLFLCSTSGHQFCLAIDEDNVELFVDPMNRCLSKKYGLLKTNK